MTIQNPSHLKHTLITLAVRSSIVALGLAHASSHAADIPVTSMFDDNGNGCTLREAINSANTSIDQNNGCAVGSDLDVDRIVLSNAVFSANSTINLSSGQLYLEDKNVEITAESVSGGVSIVASNNSRVMRINDGNVALENLTLTGGDVQGSQSTESYAGSGGGLLIENTATVSLSNSHVQNNQGGRNTFNSRGGGIFVNRSRLTLINSSVTNNALNGTDVRGGGIGLLRNSFLELDHSEISLNTVTTSTSATGAGLRAENNNTIVISNSLISNNTGGAINLSNATGTSLDLIDSVIEDNNQEIILATGSGGEVNIVRSTITNNQSRGSGTVTIADKEFTIVDSTISHNISEEANGGTISVNRTSGVIHNSTVSNNSITGYIGTGSFATIRSSQVTLNHVTAVDNQLQNSILGYFGLYISGADTSVSIQNSIIANPTPTEGPYAGDCFISPFDATMATVNIDASTIIEDGSCDASRSGDPDLLELADNGGPTLTRALASNSIAINTGDINTCLSTDQRGESRDSQCDVGAFERQASDTDSNTTTFVIPLPNGKTVIFDL